MFYTENSFFFFISDKVSTAICLLKAIFFFFFCMQEAKSSAISFVAFASVRPNHLHPSYWCRGRKLIMRLTSCLMNLQTDRHPEMHSNGARGQNHEPGVGGRDSRVRHIIARNTAYTLHCDWSVYVYGTQRHEVEGRLGAHGLSHGDIRLGGGGGRKTADGLRLT